MDSKQNALFDRFDVTDLDYWHEKLTSSKAIDFPATEIDCVNQCINVKRDECDFILFDKGNLTCHVGIFSETSGKAPIFSNENITLFALKSKPSLAIWIVNTFKNMLKGEKFLKLEKIIHSNSKLLAS